MTATPGRKAMLAGITAAHDAWEARHLGGAEMDKARAEAKPGSDYNLHYLDVDPPAGVEEMFQAAARRHLRAIP